MKLVVDRIEGDYVVCENQETSEMINLDRFYFPENVKDGQLLDFSDGIITILSNEESKNDLRERMNKLWK